MAEGSLLGAYRFHSYKRDRNDKDTPEVAEVTVLEADGAKLDDAAARA